MPIIREGKQATSNSSANSSFNDRSTKSVSRPWDQASTGPVKPIRSRTCSQRGPDYTGQAGCPDLSPGYCTKYWPLPPDSVWTNSGLESEEPPNSDAIAVITDLAWSLLFWCGLLSFPGDRGRWYNYFHVKWEGVNNVWARVGEHAKEFGRQTKNGSLFTSKILRITRSASYNKLFLPISRWDCSICSWIGRVFHVSLKSNSVGGKKIAWASWAEPCRSCDSKYLWDIHLCFQIHTLVGGLRLKGSGLTLRIYAPSFVP